jgi:hypothetical protein
MKEEIFPSFFEQVPAITTYDPLAEVLGSVKGGIIKFTYKMIVKVAGHSCPTVAGAYLMSLKALDILYPDTPAIRGQIRVEFQESLQSGVTGVISNVISNITGATKISGFKGLGGNFERHSLMDFEKDISLHVKFTRVDTKASVELSYNPNVVPPSARLQEVMKKVLNQSANEQEIKEFGILWQDRVKKILLDNIDNDKMVIIKKD